MNPKTTEKEIVPQTVFDMVNKTVPPPSKRQTVVTKGISRTIQTAQYFSLTISHTAQDVLEWETIEEREKKMSNLTSLTVKDFVEMHNKVLDKLKLGQMHAFKTDHVAKKAAEKAPELLEMEELETQ